MNLSSLTKALILIGMLGTACFALISGEPGKIDWWKGGAPILLLLLAPFALFWLLENKMVHNTVQAWILLISVAIYTIGGLSIIYDSLFVSLDAQAGLVMVIIPFYGSILVVITAISLLFTKKPTD